ncbi:very short patch repair endonuclease [uncultured Salinicola sp.]|uniref:very short patch repair endonuclease n=1 Tax=uncultured Salinicola sp. TaxID=1193542 RepID=UPI002635D878|nr:very short patch repair endonuclease [uncultured Salinicola sp.]
MRTIKGQNTHPEIVLRKYLHARGYRFRLHRKGLSGSPDIVLPRHNLVIFVHGCFWHRHANCFYTTMPKTRPSFWQAKFEGNTRRDRTAYGALNQAGWRILVVWECGIKHWREQMCDIPELIQTTDQYHEWPAKPPRMGRKPRQT